MVEPEKPKRQPGYAASLIVIALMIVGMLLFIAAPLVFAPPLYYSTWLFYLVALLAWVPVYAGLVWRKIIFARHVGRVIFLGMLLFCCIAMLAQADRPLFTFRILETITCTEQPASEGLVRYYCVRNNFESVDQTQLIEGQPGSLFFRLVETGYIR
jgi:hypothetical protein